MSDSLYIPDMSLDWHASEDSGFNTHVGPVHLAYKKNHDIAGPRHLWFARMEIAQQHLNQGGVCHGGVMMSLADISMGSATYFSGGYHGCATIQMDSQFLAAGKVGQTLLAISHQNRRTRDLSFMTCEIWASLDGQLDRQVMAATGIWKYLASASPKRQPID